MMLPKNLYEKTIVDYLSMMMTTAIEWLILLKNVSSTGSPPPALVGEHFHILPALTYMLYNYFTFSEF